MWKEQKWSHVTEEAKGTTKKDDKVCAEEVHNID
jgi:hypothetical protein